MSINDGGQAFPRSCGQCGSDVEGMTLRDWFAGMALQGIHAACDHHEWPDRDWHESASKCAFDSADAMLAEKARRDGVDSSPDAPALVLESTAVAKAASRTQGRSRR